MCVCACRVPSAPLLHSNRMTQPMSRKQVWMLLAAFFRFVSNHGFPREFDHTLGFPGEGPPPDSLPKVSRWSLSTLNVGSLKTSTFWQSSEDDVYCLQETRVGRNNHRTMRQQVAATKRTLFCGDLLAGIIRTDGRHITMHGGTAIIAADSIARPFLPEDDCTGLYPEVLRTKRANACWIQVTPTMRAIVFSVYAKTGASASPEVIEYNNWLLSQILVIVAQFGAIPVIIAGDFQVAPLAYEAVSHAIHFEGWQDPLCVVDDAGNPSRPLTFSSDSTFTAEGEGSSSIDGILLNRVAFAALQHIEVIKWSCQQHRPIRATFQWAQIFQIGEVLKKFAPLKHDHVVPQVDPVPETPDVHRQLWDCDHLPKFDAAQDVCEKWSIVNDFCVQSLLRQGSTWGFGPRKRGSAPEFAMKQISPGQLPSGGASASKGSRLYKILRQLWELETRAQRTACSLRDCIVFQRTARKAWRTLNEFKCPCVWPWWVSPTLLQIFDCIRWAQDEVRSWENTKRLARINAWKERMRESAKGNKQHLFQHLKNKTVDEPANLVTDSAGNILYNPDEAILAISSEWDEVYSANVEHQDPIKMLEVIWPYVPHKPCQPQLPELSGIEICKTIQSRNPIAAPGLDGWRTADLQHLPIACCDAIAYFFRHLEDNCGSDIPAVLVCAKQVILNKPGPATPLNKRLITILSPMLLAYTGTRFRHLQDWQNEVFPNPLWGHSFT